MHEPSTAGLRGLRAAVFGSATLLLAAAAHVVAGGPLPSLPLLLGAGIPVGCAAVVLARRTRGPLALVGTLAVAQLLLHEAFMTGAAAGCDAMPSTPGTAHAGHGLSAVTCAGMPSMATATMPSAWMVALHVVATAATAALLVHGERVASRLLAWMLPRVVGPSIVRVAVASPRAIVVRVTGFVAQLLGTDDLSRRGPPAVGTPSISFPRSA